MGDSVLGPGPGPPQTWLCTRLLRTGQVPAHQGPRPGAEGEPPPHVGLRPPLQHCPLLSSSHQLGHIPAGPCGEGQAPGHTAGEDQPQPAQSRDRPCDPSSDSCHWSCPGPHPLHTLTHLTACSPGGRGPERFEPVHDRDQLTCSPGLQTPHPLCRPPLWPRQGDPRLPCLASLLQTHATCGVHTPRMAADPSRHRLPSSACHPMPPLTVRRSWRRWSEVGPRFVWNKRNLRVRPLWARPSTAYAFAQPWGPPLPAHIPPPAPAQALRTR